MNRNTVLNMDLMEDHSYLQYSYLPSNDPFMHTNNTDQHIQIISQQQQQHNDNNAASHNSHGYLNSKSSTNNNSNTCTNQNNGPVNKQPQQTLNLNSPMNQTYSMNINAQMSTMGGNMLHQSSPSQIQMSQQIDQHQTNSLNNNHQNRFCKNTNNSNMNHYETTLQQTYHQQSIQNHHSPSSNRNHFTNENINHPNTMSHISGTDGNYNSQRQNQQTIVNKLSMGKNNLNNLVSTPQTYSSINCHAATDWTSGTTISTHVPNTQRLKNTTTTSNNNNSHQINYNSIQDELRFSYLEPEFSPMPATPLTIQVQNESPFKTNIMNHDQNLEVDKNNSITINNEFDKIKSPPSLDSCDSNDCKKKLLEKRHVVIFKIVEQLVDPETKCIISETITKNEEIVIPSFSSLTSQDQISDPTISGKLDRFQSESSNLLLTSGLSNSKKLNQSSAASSISNSNEYRNNISKSDEHSGQLSCLSNMDCSIKSASELNNKVKNMGSSKIKPNETENDDYGAASALLSLQTAQTPVKNTEAKACPNSASSGGGKSVKVSRLSLSDDNKNDDEELIPVERLKPGMKIMAKWKDKNFYPAETIKQHETHRWMVRFEDMATKNLFESEIIRVEHLVYNKDVMVKISEELFKISKIKKIIKTDNNKNYEFDLEHIGDDEKTRVTKRYPLKDLFLYAEQGQNILNKVSKHNTTGAVFADVDLDNIVSGKRSRSTVMTTTATNTNNNSNSSSSSSYSGTKSNSSNINSQENLANSSKKLSSSSSSMGTKNQHHSNENSDNDYPALSSSSSTNKKRKTIDEDYSNSSTNTKSNRKPETQKSSSKNSSTKSSSTSLSFDSSSFLENIGRHNHNYHQNTLAFSPCPSKSTANTMPSNELEKIFGPIPKPGTRIFQNMNFILTSMQKNEHDLLETDGSNPECSTPFDKDYLIKQINSGSGKVYDSFEEMRKGFHSFVDYICIADTYSRSIKFIQCLAAGVQIVSHQWIIECCRQNRKLERDSYILPAGYSIITNALVSDKNAIKKSSLLFKGTKFYFGSERPQNLHFIWSPVLFAAQAIIVEGDNENFHKSLQRGQVDIIIADSSCPVSLVYRAKQLKIPVVSTEYIVQCLINGRKLACDASPTFSYLANKMPHI